MKTPHVAVACHCMLGESPAWSARTQSLYWVDIRAPALHRLHVESGQHMQWSMPELCCAVVTAANGVVVALRTSIAHFDPASGQLGNLVEVEPAALANRLNEARCDRAGRLWIGSMRDFGAAVTGALYVIGADRTPRAMLSNLCVPNSLAWSPDNTTMYFADTRTGALMAYPFDLATATMGEGEEMVGAGDAPGVPDGCAIDAAGHLWNARFRAGLIARISPDGRVVESIRLPVTQPTSCTFGGRDMKTLFITTARQKLSSGELARQPTAGDLYALRVDTPGLPDAEFAYL